jgi:general stress protein YciG
MAGTKKGGIHFYENIGRKGGAMSKGGGFAKNPELARIAGRKGGAAGRRGPIKHNNI